MSLPAQTTRFKKGDRVHYIGDDNMRVDRLRYGDTVTVLGHPPRDPDFQAFYFVFDDEEVPEDASLPFQSWTHIEDAWELVQ
jgi:hypothetical protein